MTIEKLIEKLKAKSLKRYEKNHSINSAYAILEAWCKEIQNIHDYTSDPFYHYYDLIWGFIEGLRAAFFITEEEHRQLREGLDSLAFDEEVYSCDR